ncbi:thiamine biosynthesis/tRNA modification protein ThiI [Shewanella halifaxensis HAW-EB4]|uniref:tRNA sulfurtransferase n=1 Tax=Shewanella halifaxensis (strain HAW-EB4) TaxID=458817 RepID=THII_SHEHH|nr:tRNA uracil 4-sulfurtransferase ThiI [Shewanella halifaxensis]B0TQ31.1 RecName: Full=tRNA sulfurtransferase; AltName: Full=Sulfur carrier protein ThiS sulfurtransferase; AltName: Full=Thiamine biosynthesis protein ThiI; AltName: Full=tRNA 4-thiouridine synthase [Shewanella halifaxensis HAW-EB4]ABZ77623.1 thiamine biosynthesis/tRNA modification protein ThiI [Shewanella halifaxensis HAW-EB4]
MKFIVKLFPEIMMKSKPVRMRFTKMLETNIRNVLKKVDESAKVQRQWDKIMVMVPDDRPDLVEAFGERLACIPGIAHVLQVNVSTFTSVDDIYQQTLVAYKEQLVGKTFCVRVKRAGKHDFNSIEVERYVGGGLNQFTEAAGVRLKNPDMTVHLEIDNDNLYLIDKRIEGLGGFPMATQEDVLSLISGGFDSGVSSYQFIKRGSRTHYCFFNLGGDQHEIGVKQVAYHLWQKYGESHKVKFISVPFDPVVQEILERIDNGQMGVILKRMMMRAATRVAQKMGIQALVTGEAMGQVSSQTLTNLNVIDRCTEQLILRPLIAMDKQDIINLSRQIGTEDFAKSIPEYCGVISQKPTVKAVLSKVEAEEAKFSEDLLDRVIADAEIIDIREIATQMDTKITETETVDSINANEIIIDVRAPEEEEKSPLKIDGVEVKAIPFYKLATQFADLDKDKSYLLYCDRGVMSKLQALYLQEQGYTNVKVYRP